jgi:HAMP domain-containing protein
MSENQEEPIKFKRRLLWIDPKFQRRGIFFLLTITFLTSSALFGVVWFHIETILKALIESGALRDSDLFQTIKVALFSLMASVLATVLIFSLLLIFVSVKTSHRVAGPLFALKRSLEQITEGNFKEARIHFRPGDEFHEMAATLNRMVDELERRNP